jgi:hypothetical protein
MGTRPPLLGAQAEVTVAALLETNHESKVVVLVVPMAPNALARNAPLEPVSR